MYRIQSGRRDVQNIPARRKISGRFSRRMSAIRGEKITFRKKDIVSLHSLPSAQIEDPIIVHCPPPRSRMRKTAKLTGGLCAVILFVIAAIVFTVEGGMFDELLSKQAQTALNAAIGPRYRAEVGS